MNIQSKTMVAGVGLLLLARTTLAGSSVPPALNYQGRLQPDQGAVSAGAYALQFRAWSAATGGTQLWARAFSPVYVASNGVFNVTLTDAGAELLAPPQASDLLTAFGGGPAYLGITVVQTPAGPVASPQQITPVRPFLSVPYSLTAHLADDVHGLLGRSNLLTRWPAFDWPLAPVYAIGSEAKGTGSIGVSSKSHPVVAVFPLNTAICGSTNGIWFAGLGMDRYTPGPTSQVAALFCNWLHPDMNILGPVRMLQPAGPPTGSIALTTTNTVSIKAPQDGLLALTLPTNVWSKVSVSGGAMGGAFTCSTASAGAQTVRFLPVNRGSNLTITTVTGNAAAAPATYKFLPFGGAL